jgi:hypothetical protein
MDTKPKTQKRNAQLLAWLKAHPPKNPTATNKNYANASRVFHLSRERIRQIVKESGNGAKEAKQ